MWIEEGLSREASYDMVKPRAMRAWEERRSFREIVEADASITAHLSR